MLYAIGWMLALPAVLAYLLWRSRRQPDYRQHWGERFGLSAAQPGEGPCIWIHAVSVGETRAALPLVRALAQQRPDARFLITCMTPTGRETAQALYAPLLGTRFAQSYLPYDGYGAPARFLEAWKPTLGILMETELWPELVRVATRSGVPMTLVNARLSERSAARGRWQRAWVVPAARQLAVVCAQSDADARRIQTLTGRPVDAVTGNLKFDISPSAQRMERGRAWRDRIGRPVVLAASTREGEEGPLREAWLGQTGRLRPSAPLLVIVPRHPQRFDAVADEARSQGWRVARRAALDADETDWETVDLLVGDSMGEMDAWYALAEVAIIGGSLQPFGAQNPIEALAVGCPVLIGPSTYNFAEVSAGALASGAAWSVSNPDEAVRQALRLVQDPAARQVMARAGAAFTATHRGATARTVNALRPWLEVSGPTPAGPPQPVAPAGH